MSTEMRRWNEPVVTDWHTQAICRTRDVSPQVWRLFDPVGLDEPKQQAWDRARLARDHFCSVCPVRAACAAEGAEHDYEGLWGGEFRERRGVVDLDTGMVVRGEWELVNPDDLDDLLAADEDELDEVVLDMPADIPAEPEPVELPALTPAPPAPPTPEPARPARRRRFGLRRPRHHRAPTAGVQLALDDVSVPRRRATPRRDVHEPDTDWSRCAGF
jgi:hypothetical protein